MREILQPIVSDAIDRKVTPGAVILVSEAGVIRAHEAFGRLCNDGPSTSLNTIYDAASITKAVVTSTLLMGFVAHGAIDLDSKISHFVPELVGPGKDEIELRHLLGHASGLPAHVHFFERIWSGDLAGTCCPWDALVKMAGAEPLMHASEIKKNSNAKSDAALARPGQRVVYSDLGYILLGRLIENLANSRLHEAFTERIAKPLGLTNSQFVELSGSPNKHPNAEHVAPTGEGPTPQIGERKMICGRVHDDNTRAGGGVSGHAGLFTTAADLATWGQALCDASQGRGGFLPEAIVNRFWTTTAAPDTTWRMGFDSPSAVPGLSHAGEYWPKSGVGHLGFTGTSIWLAPRHNRIVVILTNRTYFSWKPAGIKALRRSLMHAIGSALTWH